jgi:hypothetical protein
LVWQGAGAQVVSVHTPVATEEHCAEKEKQIAHPIFPLSRDPQAPSVRTHSKESSLWETRESATHSHFLISRRSLLAGLVLAGALGLGTPAEAATDQPTAQGDDPAGVAPWTTASSRITPIWQGEPSEYQNQREWQREHDHTCSLTAIAIVLNAWYDARNLTGKHFAHIRDVLQVAMHQWAYIPQAGTYWIGSIAPIAAHFGFRTIWGYDATSYLTYAAAVFDTMAGHDLFKALEYLIFGATAPRLMHTLKQQARALFLKETQNKVGRQVPLELVRHIATRGFPVLVDLWSPQMPDGHTVIVYGGEGDSVSYVDPGSGSYEQAQIETFRQTWVRDFAVLYPRQVQFPRDLGRTLQYYPSVYAH